MEDALSVPHDQLPLHAGPSASGSPRSPWAAYWRAREFEADKYAAGLGQSQELARFLDTNALVHDLPVPFMWMSEQSHPATEHRIDRLHQQDVPA